MRREGGKSGEGRREAGKGRRGREGREGGESGKVEWRQEELGAGRGDARHIAGGGQQGQEPPQSMPSSSPFCRPSSQ